jgi:23S rRNA (pseudouridine1915-N3)-methyltransferase
MAPGLRWFVVFEVDSMRLTVVAIGRRMPDWVASGWAEYAERMPREWPLQLHALAEPARSRSLDPVSTRRLEGQALQRALPAGSLRVILDAGGQAVSTAALARRLGGWQDSGRDVCFVIGGAGGLEPEILQQGDWVWSLSPLTFPHMLVRVLVAEQLYRAWSILNHHPYHRE